MTIGQQFLPALSVAPGRIDVIWYDSRNYDQGDFVDVFYDKSLDQGQSFTSDLKINDRKVPTENTGNAGFIGHYIGIASSSGYVYPVWTGQVVDTDLRDLVFGLLSYADFSVTVTPAIVTHTYTGYPPTPLIQTATFTVTVTSLNSFTGSVSLTITPYYSSMLDGPVTNFHDSGTSFTSVTVPSGGSANAVIDEIDCRATRAKTYTFTITGLSGPLSHTATFQVIIQGTNRLVSCPIF